MDKFRILGILCLVLVLSSCIANTNSSSISQKISSIVESSGPSLGQEANPVSSVSVYEPKVQSTAYSQSEAYIDHAEEHFGNGLVMKYEKVYQFSSEAGFIKAFYNENGIFYMVVDIYGEMGRAQYEYFFEDTSTIISQRIINYTEPMYMEDFKIEEVVLERYIYSDNVLYDLSTRDETIIAATDKQQEVVERLNRFME